MTDEDYAALSAVASELVELVGTSPFIDELLRQAEVEEAIASLRYLANEKGIVLPAALASSRRS
jgi:hypothetical protein